MGPVLPEAPTFCLHLLLRMKQFRRGGLPLLQGGLLSVLLVTEGKSGQHYVFVIPVREELDLKKAAKVSGEKAIVMIKQKELLPLTGYIHGGCSPIGMKKPFPSFLDETAELFDTVCVSAGKVGAQVELSPQDLIRAAELTTADLVTDDRGA